MKIVFTVLFFFTSVIHIAQTVKVIKTEKLISGDDVRLYFPKFNPDGS